MTEQDILNLIQKDEWMMKVLQIAEKQNLKDWVIGAGFVRNKVWDYLHDFQKEKVDTPDIDLVYFDPAGNNMEEDEAMSEKLKQETTINWEIVNEAYAHVWNHTEPYSSTEDALSKWTETATGIGVRLKNDKLILMAPHGISDLVNLIVRPSPNFPGCLPLVKKRIKEKKWLEKWPKLKIIE